MRKLYQRLINYSVEERIRKTSGGEIGHLLNFYAAEDGEFKKIF